MVLALHLIGLESGATFKTNLRTKLRKTKASMNYFQPLIENSLLVPISLADSSRKDRCSKRRVQSRTDIMTDKPTKFNITTLGIVLDYKPPQKCGT